MQAQRFTSKGIMSYLINNKGVITRVDVQLNGNLYRYTYYGENSSKGVPCRAKKYRDSCIEIMNQVNTLLD
jgi:hypothetical protein